MAASKLFKLLNKYPEYDAPFSEILTSLELFKQRSNIDIFLASAYASHI
jgi:hypothetical protein